MEEKTNIPVLEIKNLCKFFGNRQILRDINMKVYPGEVLGFLGPNGSGKTTTIKSVLGLINIDMGEVYIAGKNIKSDFESAISNVGGIIENPEMYKYLSGRKNLMQYLRMYDDIPESRIDEVVKIVGLQSRIDDKISRYSLGMRQRLGIAQAILHRPKLLILDEPTNGLDPAGIKELREIFKKLAHEEGCAVLVSSHMLAELEQMCDRVYVIDRGTMVSDMTIDEIHNGKSEETIRYEIETDEVEKAASILSKLNVAYEIEDGHLMMEIEKKQLPEVNKALVIEDVPVFGITPQKKSLEDAFMQITKNDKERGVGI